MTTTSSPQQEAVPARVAPLRLHQPTVVAERPAGAIRTRAEVFASVLVHGPISRTQIADMTGLSPSTVTKAVTPMLEGDYLYEGSATESSGPGRPQRLLHVNRLRHTVIGIKLAPDHVVGVVTDLRARILDRKHELIDNTHPSTVIGAAAHVVAELLSRNTTERGTCLGIGVGVGGHIDAVNGVCRRSGILGWENVDVGDPLARATGLPVVVNNDVNTLVVAEQWFGAGRGLRSFAVVTVGAGVGCGLLLDGKLFAGATGLAGEFGHLPLDAEGPPCNCGNRGCLEAVAADSAILRRIENGGGPTFVNIDEAAQAARSTTNGDLGEIARESFRTAGDAVGRGLAAILNLLNLERVVLSGEGVVAADLFDDAMRTAMHKHAFSTAATDSELVVQALDEEQWARGAACLLIKESVGSPSPP